MTKEEFLAKREELEDEIRDKREELNRAYAESHSPAEVGDIVSDRWYTIRVERIDIVTRSTDIDGNYISGLPTICYYGPKADKKGVPCRSGARGIVYQEQVRNVIKKAKEQK